jgi:integrative and conjugative element protein (TIGR02256 family)
VLWRRAGGGLAGSVWLPEELQVALEADADEHDPCETGGMLIGYPSEQSLVITRLVPGGPGAIREHARFEPDGEWQQAELERVYAESGRIETYLGDWHSHPIGVARPSRRDRRTAARIARDRHARCRNPLTLIAGKSWRDGWEFAPFIYRGWRGFLKVSLETYRR